MFSWVTWIEPLGSSSDGGSEKLCLELHPRIWLSNKGNRWEVWDTGYPATSARAFALGAFSCWTFALLALYLKRTGIGSLVSSIKKSNYDRLIWTAGVWCSWWRGIEWCKIRRVSADNFHRSDQIVKGARFLLVLRWGVRFKRIFSLTVRFKNSAPKANARGTSSDTAHCRVISKGPELVHAPLDREMNALSRGVTTKNFDRETREILRLRYGSAKVPFALGASTLPHPHSW